MGEGKGKHSMVILPSCICFFLHYHATTPPRYHQARDEQLLLEPLAHLFPYPAFCYLLSPCTADAEQRLTRGLQASHQPSPSLQPSSQPYPRP